MDTFSCSIGMCTYWEFRCFKQKSIDSMESQLFDCYYGKFDLYSRQITSISTGTFTGLTQLTTLLLYSNQLTSLDPSIFNGLTKLRRLDLDQNQLTSLDASIFKGLSQLESLSLNNNNFTSLE